MMASLRLWLAKQFLPEEYRLYEVGPTSISKGCTIRSDLIRGGDALARGWGCSPEILYAAAEHFEKAGSKIELENCGKCGRKRTR